MKMYFTDIKWGHDDEKVYSLSSLKYSLDNTQEIR